MPAPALPHRPRTANAFMQHLDAPNRAQCVRASGTTSGRLFGEVDAALLLQRTRIFNAEGNGPLASHCRRLVCRRLDLQRTNGHPATVTANQFKRLPARGLPLPPGACPCRQWPDAHTCCVAVSCVVLTRKWNAPDSPRVVTS